MPKLLPAQLLEHSKRVGWFHSIDLGGGRFTQGHKSPERLETEATAWQFPADFSGKSVLNIGCADGGHSIIAMQRGARAVLSIDEQTTDGLKFLLEHGVFPINFQQIDLFSNEFMQLPEFDIVIFAGVLYHVHDPLEALKRVRTKTRELAILETTINESLGSDVPYAIFYEGSEQNNDPTNWWDPNTPCLEGMIRTAGFQAMRVFIETHGAHARVAYHLRPDDSVLFSKTIESETGSHSMLEQYRHEIAQYIARISELEAQLAAFSAMRTQAADHRIDYVGHIDEVSTKSINGWCKPQEGSTPRAVVEIYEGETLIASALADQFREDLLILGGDGRHAFRCRLPDSFSEGTVHFIRVCAGSDHRPLTPMPIEISPAMGA